MKIDTNNDDDWGEVLRFFNKPGRIPVVDYEETAPGVFRPAPGPVASPPPPRPASPPPPVADSEQGWLQLVILMACLASYAAGVLTVMIMAEVLR